MKQRRSQDTQNLTRVVTVDEAKAYEEHALRELRAAGFRITMPRVQVIRALADTTHALSAYAIHEKIINSGGKIDVVSVYRILSTLQEVGLIHHIGVVDGYFPCRLPGSHGKRSEVVVCEPDMQVIELDLPKAIVAAIDEQAAKHGFSPAQIKVEIVSTTTPGK